MSSRQDFELGITGVPGDVSCVPNVHGVEIEPYTRPPDDVESHHAA
jgi:hypothetical protein